MKQYHLSAKELQLIEEAIGTALYFEQEYPNDTKTYAQNQNYQQRLRGVHQKVSAMYTRARIIEDTKRNAL